MAYTVHVWEVEEIAILRQIQYSATCDMKQTTDDHKISWRTLRMTQNPPWCHHDNQQSDKKATI